MSFALKDVQQFNVFLSQFQLDLPGSSCSTANPFLFGHRGFSPRTYCQVSSRRDQCLFLPVCLCLFADLSLVCWSVCVCKQEGSPVRLHPPERAHVLVAFRVPFWSIGQGPKRLSFISRCFRQVSNLWRFCQHFCSSLWTHWRYLHVWRKQVRSFYQNQVPMTSVRCT